MAFFPIRNLTSQINCALAILYIPLPDATQFCISVNCSLRSLPNCSFFLLLYYSFSLVMPGRLLIQHFLENSRIYYTFYLNLGKGEKTQVHIPKYINLRWVEQGYKMIKTKTQFMSKSKPLLSSLPASFFQPLHYLHFILILSAYI